MSWQTARETETIVTMILVDKAASIITRSVAGSFMPHRRCKASDTMIASETQSAVYNIVSGQDVVQTGGFTYQLENNHRMGQIRMYSPILVGVMVPIKIVAILPSFLCR
jgi:hypothetical protein